MILDAMAVFQTFLHIVYAGILIFGLVVCIKQSLNGGIAFFAIFLLKSIYFIFSNRILDNIITSDNILLGLTVGEFLFVLNIILKMIDIIAIYCLVSGLLQLFRRRREESNIESNSVSTGTELDKK